jgi:hypothetical protein
MHRRWLQRCACGIPNRFLRFPGPAHFQMRLHQLPQQILPHRAQLSFQIAVAQLVGCLPG